MKKVILAVLVLLGLQTQAQSSCDSTMSYTTGSQFQLEIAFGVGGNTSSTWSAPIYVWTYADTIILGEDSCFSGPCNHFVYNCCSPTGMPFDTITTCVSYEHTSSMGTLDTSTCCFDQYWGGAAWQRSAAMTVGVEEHLIIKTNNNKMYDLNGREILKPQGLYIKNGRLYYER